MLLLFNISLGSHPANITGIFKKSNNFDRNLDYIQFPVVSAHLLKQVPMSLVASWNSLPNGLKGWLKQSPSFPGIKNKGPTRVLEGNNMSLNKYRLKGVKDAYLQTITSNYKSQGKCKSNRCRECMV